MYFMISHTGNGIICRLVICVLPQSIHPSNIHHYGIVITKTYHKSLGLERMWQAYHCVCNSRIATTHVGVARIFMGRFLHSQVHAQNFATMPTLGPRGLLLTITVAIKEGCNCQLLNDFSTEIQGGPVTRYIMLRRFSICILNLSARRGFPSS